MKAIILAAGMALRFGEFLKGRPKCLLEVAGVSILDRQIALLRDFGVKEFVIVKGFMAHKITVSEARYCINPDYESTNMVHSLFCAESELSGDVLICYADILYDEESLSRVLGAIGCPIAVAVDMEWERYYSARYNDPFVEAESLVFDNDFRIKEIGGATPTRDRIQAQYIGLIKLNAEGALIFRRYHAQFAANFGDLPWIRGRTLKKAYMTDFLQAIIDENVRVQAVSIEGGWLEFDSLSDYEKVQEWHAAGMLDKFCRLQ